MSLPPMRFSDFFKEDKKYTYSDNKKNFGLLPVFMGIVWLIIIVLIILLIYLIVYISSDQSTKPDMVITDRDGNTHLELSKKKANKWWFSIFGIGVIPLAILLASIVLVFTHKANTNSIMLFLRMLFTTVDNVYTFDKKTGQLYQPNHYQSSE